MSKDSLKTQWKNEEDFAFQGWDFSYINDRISDQNLPWDYRTLVNQYLKPNSILLDMGTGGGEFLLSLNHPYDKTTITESYAPNIKLCQQTLTPLGIRVVPVEDDAKIPLLDKTFDIIINRHESYDINEVKRLLKPNGYFITQQVGGQNNNMLSKIYDPNFKPSYPNHYLEHEKSAFINAGFDILFADEFFPYLRFNDIGAVVYFSKIIPWEFPNFSVKNNYQQLIEINKEIEKNKYFESLEHRFIIVAKLRKQE